MDARWYVISTHTTDVNECILIVETYELKLVNKCVMCHRHKKNIKNHRFSFKFKSWN